MTDAATVPSTTTPQLGQIPTGEEPKAATPAPEAQLSPKFAELARREKQIRLAQQKMKAEREAWEAHKSEYQSAAEIKARLAKDPMNVLQEFGITYDQLTNSILNGPKPEDIQRRQEFEQIADQRAQKAAEDAAKRLFDEQQTKQYEQAVTQIRNDVKILVESEPSFEMVKAMGAEEAVVELIRKEFDSTGNLLTIEQAAKEVEDYLLEEGMKLANHKKIQEKLKPAAPPPAQIPEPKAATRPPSITLKTLTNAVAATTAPKGMSEKERRDRAILAFQGKLQQ